MASGGDDDRKGKRKMTEPRDKQMPRRGRGRTTGGSSSAADRDVARDMGRRDQMSECWSFFFSSLFSALCQRGRKLEGPTTFSMPWRLLQLELCSYPFRVVFVK